MHFKLNLQLTWTTFFSQFLLWLFLLLASIQAEFGIVFFVTSGFYLIWSNLGMRKKGTASAYSIFNKDFKAIDGTLTAEMFEKEIR